MEFRVPVHHHADPVHQRPARSVRGNPLAVDIFAANILLGSLASLATAKFIKRKGLASAAYNQEQARAGQIRALSVAAIIAVSMAVAWQNPDTAKYL